MVYNEEYQIEVSTIDVMSQVIAFVKELKLYRQCIV